MGFEYKIIAQFTEKQVSEVEKLLETKKEFDKKYEFDTKMFYDFRQVNNKGKMPNISVFLKNEGIYICRYDTSNVWQNLQELKEYLENENVEYKVLDYQE